MAKKTTTSKSVREGYWARDQLLRSRGFAVHSRPSVGVSTWKRDGRLFSFEEAYTIARAEAKVEEEKRRADETPHL